MSNVSAYVDLPKGEFAPITENHNWAEGELETQGPDGLEVTWWDAHPEGAQVYIEWNPRVFAVWEEEKKDQSDGTEVEHTGSQGSEEPGNGSGEADGGVGEEQTPADTDPA